MQTPSRNKLEAETPSKLPLLCVVCVFRRFGRGEIAELVETMHTAELEVERRVSDPVREWTWWMTAVRNSHY